MSKESKIMLESDNIEVDGLSIRLIHHKKNDGIPILFTAPWPESIYSFYRILPRLVDSYSYVAVDLPGYGHSQSRADVMSPEAMGDFIITLLKQLGITRTHVVAPDVGTPAVLFAAAKKHELFESLVLGSAATRLDLAGGILKDAIYSPKDAFVDIGAEAVKDYLTHAAQLTPADIIEDFRKGSTGRRFEDAAQFVRAYKTDLPKLEVLLPTIETPVLILAGKDDPIVPPANGQFLSEKLIRSRYVLLDAYHRVWEEAFTSYTDELISWLAGGYRSI
ncbi:alpha/beta fold hydrolase [Mucilaginibacter ginsenosidivorax]|uniref:Alpha/beta hydrolase n=1 Tax=Mucilaginibacter ginsenosidivorax TaxID=862126 RepID=A0A5B8W7F6_9SPHI|nr:alpha/beta hydrolase [Mucilaginibacter ginsenosidivorax]QEC78866.1 alpha/beta hydrolase [Mucilaginibacter ginsenosidivorax]